jgi:hypothetical protein
MAARWILPPNYEDGSDHSRIYRGKVVEAGGTLEARAVARANTPAFYLTDIGLLYRQDIRTRKTAYDEWTVEVPYGPRENASGKWTWDFDTTGGTVHITHSKQTVGAFAASGVTVIPDHKQAIDVQGDSVNGVDITIPAMRFNVSYRHPQGDITLAHARFIHDITGMVNSTAFLGFPAGEVLFLGGRGSDGTEVEATVNYAFAAAASLASYNIGEIAGVTKAGWNVAWVAYKDDIDADRLVKQPEFVYIERVYDTIDLAGALGFGR